MIDLDPSRPAPNLARARAILEWLASQGVAELCLCPGGRNAPFVAWLDRSVGFRVHPGFDERAAAFFALGRARATGRPVAICVTSGTAVAELLPATIEAHYTGDPLILVTADRPPWFRGTGAPQAIEQVGMFEPYARTVEVERETDLPLSALAGRPLHLNVPFDEPLLDGHSASELPTLELKPGQPPVATLPVADEIVAPVREAVRSWRRPLVVVGALAPEDRDAVRALLLTWRPLVYAEGPSGLREDPNLAPLMLRSGEGMLRAGGPLFGRGPDSAGVDGVLRVGSVPTTRLWRDLAGRLARVRSLSVSRLPWPGMPDGAIVHAAPRDVLPGLDPGPIDEAARDELLGEDRRRATELEVLLRRYPRSEPALVRGLSTQLGPRDGIYVGNSLPIRLWDLAAARAVPRAVRCNRGANGIDGQLSTFAGWSLGAVPGETQWGLFGDLTTLYDLSAPWMLRDAPAPVRIAVLNNGGGRIFGRLYESPLFQNRHELGFAAWSRMWGLSHARLEALPSPGDAALDDATVLELVPDLEQTEAFWAALDALHANP